MSDRQGTVDAQVLAILPYDGTPRPDQVMAAIGVMAGLARHLANATRTDAALPVPADLDAFTRQLELMLRSLPQVVNQVSERFASIAYDVRLRADQLTGSGPADELAVDAELALADAAATLVRASEHAHRAWRCADHLYWEDPNDT